MAGVGLSLAAVMVTVMGASSWWTLDTYRRSVREGREQELEALSVTLGEGLSAALERDDLASARRQVVIASHQHGLSRCTLTLGDGMVLADGVPARITKGVVPAKWPAVSLEVAGDAEAESKSEPRGQAARRAAIKVDGRGQAILELRALHEYPLLASTEVQTGIALIAAGGFAGLLLTYRKIKRRLGPLAAIRESLHSYATGERHPSVLAIDPHLGAEALAWNQLVQENESLRHRQVLDRAMERPASADGLELGVPNPADAVWFGLLLVDEAMRVRYANGAAAALLQTTVKSLQGRPATGILESREVQELMERVLSGRVRHRLSHTIESSERAKPGSSGGSVPTGSTGSVLRLSVSPLSSGSTTLAAIVLEDITQQRVSEAARSGFVAQAAHELRSPLTSIRLYQEMLVDEGDTNPAIRAKCINVIGQEARRLERMVSDMLSVSQMETGRLDLVQDDVRMDALLAELEEDYRAQAEHKRQQLAFDLAPKLPVLRGDRDKVMLLLHNLLANAIKYTPDGGRVTLSAREVSEPAPASLVIEISDTGYGIRAEECEMIFERFYRAKDERVSKVPGTGLGLTLAREIARIHGGELTVKSELNVGSVFTLRLPIAGPGGVAMARAA